MICIITSMPWTVYILLCADTTLYTGITSDLEARVAKHGNGTGAKYTRGRAPFDVVYTEVHNTRSRALKREAQIKSLRRHQKLKLAGVSLADR
jgi:putative endonuclease